jgi:hypothetical protein
MAPTKPSGITTDSAATMATPAARATT